MEKYITDERTGLRYELIGDIYYLAGDDQPEEECEPIGVWGQRHLQYIKKYKQALYSELVMTSKLNSHLTEIDSQAKDMLLRIVEEMAKSEGVTEQFKADNQMEWVQRMNNIRNRAIEVVNDIKFVESQNKKGGRSYLRSL